MMHTYLPSTHVGRLVNSIYSYLQIPRSGKSENQPKSKDLSHLQRKIRSFIPHFLRQLQRSRARRTRHTRLLLGQSTRYLVRMYLICADVDVQLLVDIVYNWNNNELKVFKYSFTSILL